MDIPKRLAEIQVRYSQRIAVKDKVKISDSVDVFKVLWDVWDKDLIAYQEAFVIILLNRANRILGYRFVSYGGLAGTVVDIKHIFGIALKCNANSIILAHNHPSGNHQPSKADISITRKINDGGKLLDIRILDHLIITPAKTYYSFSDEGVL